VWKTRFKGYRTAAFSVVLMLGGVILTGLSALDVVQLGYFLPAKLQPFAPMILAMIGAIVGYLRMITDTELGHCDHDHDHDGGQ
jgi:hypothetical protein